MSELLFDKILDTETIISIDRGERPSDFSGKIKCPFCRGNEQDTPPTKNSILNDTGQWVVRNFSNKYPAVSDKGNIKGAQDIICDISEHSQSLSDFGISELFNWLFLIQKRILQMQQQIPQIKKIFFFKNSGLKAGATLKHPHTQIVGINYVSHRYKRFLSALKRFYAENDMCYICRQMADYQIMENNSFKCFIPKARSFDYETWIAPKPHVSKFQNCEQNTLINLAEIIKNQISKINKILKNPDYNIVLMNGINNVRNELFFHWFLKIIPRTSFLAGFEFATGINIHSISHNQILNELKHIDI